MNFADLIDRFSELKVLVVGDVMIDSYLWGRVDRMSPEAPVPVVTIEKRNARLGGASNVAKNLRTLGANVHLFSVTGEDNGGNQHCGLCEDLGINEEGVFPVQGRKTTVKTRVISDDKHVVRVDDEQTDDIHMSIVTELLDKITEQMSSADLVILEDYNKGVLTEEVIKTVLKRAKEHSVPVAVDPKKKNFFAYRNVQLFKPNFKELCEGTGLEINEGDRDGIRNAVTELKKQLGNEMTMVTLSEHGVFIENGSDDHFIPAHPRNIVDVSGAGDSVIATAGLCLAAGCEPKVIAALSNLAGGIVCEQVGVVPILAEDLKRESAQLTTSK